MSNTFISANLALITCILKTEKTLGRFSNWLFFYYQTPEDCYKQIRKPTSCFSLEKNSSLALKLLALEVPFFVSNKNYLLIAMFINYQKNDWLPFHIEAARAYMHAAKNNIIDQNKLKHIYESILSPLCKLNCLTNENLKYIKIYLDLPFWDPQTSKQVRRVLVDIECLLKIKYGEAINA